MRRIVLSLSSIVAVAVTFLTAAPSAFAMRINPTSGDGPSVTRRVSLKILRKYSEVVTQV